MTTLQVPGRARASAPAALPRHMLVGRADAPVVVVLGGISATRHVVAGDTPGEPGWWPGVAGEGKAIDTDRYRVLGLDFLDGGRGAGGRPRRVVTTHDQANWLARVIRSAGVERVHAVVGSSYGGMVALAFAERFPDMLDRLVAISAPHEPHAMSTALRTLQRRTVELGLETGHIADAMSIARGIAMTTYRTATEFAERFGTAASATTVATTSATTADRSLATRDGSLAVDAYLRARGARFAATMRPERFLALSLSADLHRVDPARITTPATIVAADGDAIVPREQLVALTARLGGERQLIDLPTRVGHDAFLVETARVSSILSAALA